MGRCIQGIELKTLSGQFSGNAQAIWPTMVLMPGTLAGTFATDKYSVSYALLGVQLSSSLVIFGTNRAGLMLVIGLQKPMLTVSNSINAPISHITQPNSFTGPPDIIVPTSKVTSLSFGAYGIPIPGGTPVSLYAFGDATAGNDIFAICTLQLAQIVG